MKQEVDVVRKDLAGGLLEFNNITAKTKQNKKLNRGLKENVG